MDNKINKLIQIKQKNISNTQIQFIISISEKKNIQKIYQTLR